MPLMIQNLSDELRQLSEENLDVAYILDVYKQIESVYRESLEAMGVISKPIQDTGDSAEVTISLQPTSISFGDEEQLI